MATREECQEAALEHTLRCECAICEAAKGDEDARAVVTAWVDQFQAQVAHGMLESDVFGETG
jgi:hypothetical protein